MLSPAVDLLPRNQVALLVGATLLSGAAVLATRSVDDMRFNLSLWQEATQVTATTIWSRVSEIAGWKEVPLGFIPDGTTAIPMLPVVDGRVSPNFGQDRGDHKHAGVDIGKACGAEIVATMAGTVTRSAYSSSYGWVVYLTAGQRETRYAHMLSAPAVKEGEQVHAGQRLGNMGNTGRSYGCHLHYEVRVDGNPIDPVAERKTAITQAKSSGQKEDILTGAQWTSYLTALAKRESSLIPTKVNESCHVGLWQMNPLSLVDAGLMDANALAKFRRTDSGSGWQCRFIKDDENWSGTTLTEFLNDPAMQQQAVMKTTRVKVKQAYNDSLLNSTSTPQDVAAFAAVSHLIGGSCRENRSRETACDYFRNGTNGKDGNGTSASEYEAIGRGAV